MNLRDVLLATLSSLPGSRLFHIHVLNTFPRKHSALFPFAHPRPKTYLQDILILLSEQQTPSSPRVLVTAIEASVYTLPDTSSAILYVSKVDSTGQAKYPSPTPTLVRSFILFYADPSTRPIRANHFWIHLFARAQGQYLFPNSSEFVGKRPLTDVKLCVWWKRVLSDVVIQLRTKTGRKPKTRMYYTLPGLNELEASHSLSFASSASTPSASSTPDWIYGHPYSQVDIPLPCSIDKEDVPRNVGNCIPSFDDDPKSRFIDEIAYTTDEGVKSPQRKRTRTTSSTVDKFSNAEGPDKRDERPVTHGEIAKVSPEEFWERMSFRQECISGVVTGFFVVVISSPLRGDSSPNPPPLVPQPGQVSPTLIKRIITSLLTGNEFSTRERAVKATETLETSIRGLCDGLAPLPVIKPVSRLGPDRSRTPEPDLNRTPASPSTPPQRVAILRHLIPDLSPSPFTEPVVSHETYESHIYGSIQVTNPVSSPPAEGKDGGPGQPESVANAAPKVTVLTARKKKKRVVS